MNQRGNPGAAGRIFNFAFDRRAERRGTQHQNDKWIMTVKPKDIDANFKKKVIDLFIQRKEAVLSDFLEDQKRKLAQASSDDSDNRHIDSKNEEIISELDFLNKNIDLLEKEIDHLKEIPSLSDSKKIGFGSLVLTDRALLLVGAVQENMKVGKHSVVGISMASPFFQAMEGKKAGDEFEVNGVKHEIETVV